MPGHTCRDQGTTVWGVHIPRHTQGAENLLWACPSQGTHSEDRTIVGGHTLRGQRATGGVERAHTRAYMQDQDHFLEPAHARAHTQRSEDLYKSKFSLLTLWVGPRGDTEI